MKISQILLISTSLSLLPGAIFAAEKVETLEVATPVTSSTTTDKKVDFNGLTEEVAQALKAHGIQHTMNPINVARVDVNLDKTQQPQWIAEYDPTRAAFEALWADIKLQHDEAAGRTLKFYSESLDPADHAPTELMVAKMNLSDPTAPGTKESTVLMEVLSKYLFEQIALYDAASSVKDDQAKGINESAIKAHARSMYLTLLSVHGVIRKLTADLNTLWQAEELLSFTERSAKGQIGKAFSELSVKIANQKAAVLKLINGIENTRNSVLETLRAPNVSWFAPKNTLEQALNGEKADITVREKSVETLYNPTLNVSDAETVMSWFKANIMPVEAALYCDRAFERRKKILEIAFGRSDEMGAGDFARAGLAKQRVEAEAKAKVAAELEAAQKTTTTSTGWSLWPFSSSATPIASSSTTPTEVTVAQTEVTVPQETVTTMATKTEVSPVQVEVTFADVTQSMLFGPETLQLNAEKQIEEEVLPSTSSATVTKPEMAVDLKLSADGVDFGVNLKTGVIQALIIRTNEFLEDPTKFPPKEQGFKVMYTLISHKLAEVQNAFNTCTVTNEDAANGFAGKLTMAKEALESKAKERNIDLSKKK